MLLWPQILLVLSTASVLALALAIDLPAPEPTPPMATESPTTPVEERMQTPAETSKPRPLPPPPPRKPTKTVMVIDVTRNTSSLVSINIGSGEVIDSQSNNLTEAQLQGRAEAEKFDCLTQRKANIFMLVHLNRNWRQKLAFIQRLATYAYRPPNTNLIIVFFNAFSNILATFGTDPVVGETGLYDALAHVRESMLRDETAGVVAHWSHFQLDDALKTCYQYARIFLPQFSLDGAGQPSLLVSYFDDSAAITDETLKKAEKVIDHYAKSGTGSPFTASVSILQWPTGLPMPSQWARVSELLSSSPSYQVTAATEDNLVGMLANLAGGICNSTDTGSH